MATAFPSSNESQTEKKETRCILPSLLTPLFSGSFPDKDLVRNLAEGTLTTTSCVSPPLGNRGWSHRGATGLTWAMPRQTHCQDIVALGVPGALRPSVCRGRTQASLFSMFPPCPVVPGALQKRGGRVGGIPGEGTSGAEQLETFFSPSFQLVLMRSLTEKILHSRVKKNSY